MDQKLYALFDFQRFQKDPVLEDMINKVENKYKLKGNGSVESSRVIQFKGKKVGVRLGDDDLMSVNAAGIEVLPEGKTLNSPRAARGTLDQ